MNGVIVVYKEKNYTSFDVCALMRGILKTKKVGHGGTLDPEAEGVLPVFVGSATKLCDFLPAEGKVYEAEMTLGITTDTEDIWGNVLSEKEVCCTGEEVQKAVLSFIGEYDQVPPMYSAKKVKGRKLYDMARNGEVIERAPVRLEIYEIRILSMELPVVRFTVSCGKGTYIRSLCRDIGEKLSCGACMSGLKRLKHGVFDISEAHTVEEIESLVKAGKTGEILRPVDTLFPDFSKASVTPEGEKALLNGNLLQLWQTEKGEELKNTGNPVLIYDRSGAFKAIYEYDNEKEALKPLKMFL